MPRGGWGKTNEGRKRQRESLAKILAKGRSKSGEAYRASKVKITLARVEFINRVDDLGDRINDTAYESI